MVSLLQIRGPLVSGQEEAFAVALAEWVKEAGFARCLVVVGANAITRDDDQLSGVQLRVASNGCGDDLAEAFVAIGIPTLEPPVSAACVSVCLCLCLSARFHRLLVRSPPVLSPRQTESSLAVPLPATDSVGVELPPPEAPSLDPALPTAAYESCRAMFATVQGIGYTERFFRRLQASGVPTCALVKFLHEGDNRSDAALVASAVEAVVHACFGGVGADAGAGAEAKPPTWKSPSSWSAAFGAPLDRELYG